MVGEGERNGFTFKFENGGVGDGNSLRFGKRLRTYKRRKHTELNSSESMVVEDVLVSEDSAKQPLDKTNDGSLDMAFLQEFHRSLCKSDIGLVRIFRDSLSFYAENCCKITNYCKNTNLCYGTFSDIIVSDKFNQLCKLLFKNFEGLKIDSFLDFSMINLRMKDGSYESSPALFHSDIQQIWTKIQRCGAGIVALSDYLADKSGTSYHAQLCAQEFDQTGASGIYRTITCLKCREKVDGRDSLVCDSCEEMYHFSCIDPPPKEIPQENWYCSNCIEKGTEGETNVDLGEKSTNGLCNKRKVGNGERFSGKCSSMIRRVRKTKRVYMTRGERKREIERGK